MRRAVRVPARLLVAAALVAALAPMPPAFVASPAGAAARQHGAPGAAARQDAVLRAAAQQDDGCAAPGEEHQAMPWAQQVLMPERIWQFSQGAGVTVAVLATGVDAGHPRLRRVARGYDAVADARGADDDCAGAGTQVAGMIAGNRGGGAEFTGLAPAATILPVRIADGRSELDPAVLARGVRWAAGNGADVITVAAAVAEDDTRLAGAVADALAAGVTVVAAVGDAGEATTPYPAGYPGVIGVGAVDRAGALWPATAGSETVDLVAPGAGMVTLQRGEGMAVDVSSTALAAGIVAAAAALVRAEFPDLTREGVAHRLRATAAPAPAGPGYGAGQVDPYAAVTGLLPAATPAALPAMAPPGGDQGGPDPARRVALIGLGAVALAALVMITLAVAVPRGRRRRWRAGMAPPPADQDQSSEPGPPVPLF